MTTAVDPRAAPEGSADPAAGAEPTSIIVGYVRSPRDVLRSAVMGLTALVLVAVAVWAEDVVLGFEQDLLRLLDVLPAVAERLLTGAAQLLSGLAVLAGLVVPLVQRRLRLFGYVLAASLGALVAVTLVEAAVDRDGATFVQNELARRAGVPAADFPDTAGAAQIVAVFVVLGPFVTRRWRRAGWVLLALFVLLQLALSVHLPATLFASLAIGGTVGTLVLFAFGRPDQRPPAAAVLQALRAAGVRAAQLAPASVDARASTPYIATTEDGSRVFAKVVGADQRSADLLFRAYRWLRLKNVGDERPFSSLRRSVEHEAFVSLLARDIGVRTPRMRAAAAVGDDAMLLAFDLIPGRSLDRVDDELDDALLDETWEQVAALRRHGVAHRDLRRANVFVDEQRRAWLIDFGFSEAAASQQLLDADVAQFLASLAVHVGPERSVDSAVRVLGAEAVGRALPRLQLNALSGATRTALKRDKGLLADLQRTVAERAGVTEIRFEDLQRVNGKTLFTVTVLAVATYVLFPQFADLPGIVQQVRQADWSWAVPLVAMSAITYVGASVAVLGSVPNQLRAVPTFIAQVASSFASKLAPAAVGGMALNVRYLQKSGVPVPVAVSGVGINTVAGFLVHLGMLALFLVWAGRSAFGSIDLPDPRRLLQGFAVVAVLAVVSVAVPTVRRLLRHKLWPVVRRAGTGAAEVARRPAKLALLVGGSALVTVAYVLAAYAATQAFDANLSLAQVGAVYMVGSTLAAAAPTPGGLGALEAALIAGFTAAGLPSTIAVPAVFLYRLATFWLPILPGWLCFRWLRRNEFL